MPVSKATSYSACHVRGPARKHFGSTMHYSFQDLPRLLSHSGSDDLFEILTLSQFSGHHRRRQGNNQSVHAPQPPLTQLSSASAAPELQLPCSALCALRCLLRERNSERLETCWTLRCAFCSSVGACTAAVAVESLQLSHAVSSGIRCTQHT